ncbi:DsbA family protein [Marisediminicola senii]|uniref:DsbA family protein n=1 Tax=Marisediminicola senii TaxID=2711233 RepID=UPI0013ECBD11|nr:thioredoxin domain-containing protein [Marisediminicola senii]
MSGAGPVDRRQSKNQRREDAKEKARVLREQHRRAEKRNRFLLQGGLIVGALAIVAIVTLIIVNSIRPPGPGPLNMQSDGIVIGENFDAVPTDALADGEEPVPTAVDTEDGPIAIQIYLDYFCPVCGAFEATNADQIATLIEQNAATLEIHPVAILDNQSLGTRYSTRSANAAACVANYSPNSFFDFSALMFENQPEEGTEGLTDDELVAITTDAGVEQASSIEECITELEFGNWVEDATSRATGNEDLQNENGQFGTPTVLVNGTRYTGAPNDATAFALFVAEADGESFSESISPSPSPSAEEEPAEEEPAEETPAPAEEPAPEETPAP